MDKRKIIKFGNTSYVTTIPNEWIKQNNLEKGDSLVLKKSLNRLVYSVEKEQKPKQVELSIDKTPLKVFNKKLFSYYLKNYEEIKITSADIVEKLDQIKQFKDKLCSMEIFEIGKDYVVLKDTSKTGETPVPELVEKLQDVISLMFEELLKENRRTILLQLDSNVNKMSFLTFKTINYALENFLPDFDNKNSVYYWRIVSGLETIGDVLKDINRHIKRVDEKTIETTKKLLKDLLSYYNFIKDLTKFSTNLEKNIQIYVDKKQSLRKSIEEFKSQYGTKQENMYYLMTQFSKTIIEELDTIVLSCIDIYLK